MAARPYPPHVRDRLLARVAAGELIARICAEPGQPSPLTVSDWARRDPGFAARLAAAKRSGRDIRRLAFDPARAARLLERLAAGEPIPAILADPAMPSRRAYAHWRATRPHFAAEVARLNALKQAAKVARCKARTRAFDRRLAHTLVARVVFGTLLRDAPETPCGAVLARWRRERPDFDAELKDAIAFARARRRRPGTATPERVEAIWRRVLDGDTLATIGRQPDMPCRTTLYAWMRRNPVVRDAVAQALYFRRDLLNDQAGEVGRRRAAGLEGAKRAWENLVGRVRRIDARLERWGYYDG